MRVLGLDSSGLVASVAIVQDDTLLGEYTTNHKKTHSQTLLPMLVQLMDQLGMDMDAIDAIAIAGGPGSFTGLRISSASAKGLGLAADLPLVHVPTLEGLAYNLWGTDAYVCPLMDARRNQVYTGIYSFSPDAVAGDAGVERVLTVGKAAAGAERVPDVADGDDGAEDASSAEYEASSECDAKGDMFTVIPQCAVGIDEIVNRVNTLGHKVIFLGDGVPVFSDYIKENCQVDFSFAPAHMNRQRASSIAALGLCYAKAGLTESADEHKPDYLRLSQAERERLAAGLSTMPEGGETKETH